MSTLWPRSTRTRPWSRLSASKLCSSKNLQQTEQSRAEQSATTASVSAHAAPTVGGAKRRRQPVSQQEVVRLDVGVDDADGVQLLHHAQDAAGEVHDQRRRHHFLAQAFVDVHCVLGAESQREVTGGSRG